MTGPSELTGAAAMRSLADALVYAVSYINCRALEEHDSRYDDGDVGALESIAGLLHDATDEEQDALAAAAERALEGELALPNPRQEFVADYTRWMEDLFGEGWRGNQRTSVNAIATETSLYVAQWVGVAEERWYEDHADDSKPIRNKKRHFLHQMLFTAADAEAAYERVRNEIENDSDCNHDGEGDITFLYNVGIHEIERLHYPAGQLLEWVRNHEYGFQLGTFAIGDVDGTGVPLIRRKDELAIFLRL